MSIKAAACAVAICLGSSAAFAQPAPGADPMAKLGPVLPVQQIARILRTHGFVPQATPVRNGEAYQVRAIDRMGRQVRVAVDARYGDILVVRPIAMAPSGAYGPYGPPPGYYGYGGPPPYYYGGAYPPSPGVRPLPPPDQSAALTPVHPPLPRPKPAAKPAAVTPAPATAPEATPSSSAPASAPPAAEAPAAAPAAPAAAPAAPAAAPSIPPVAPLE